MDNTVCSRCSISQITQFRRCLFDKDINIFRHLKLEIPASNDEKYNITNSAGQGLRVIVEVAIAVVNRRKIYMWVI